MKSAVAAAWERRIDQPHSPGAFRRIGNLEPCGQENLNAVRAVCVCLLHHVQDASGFDALPLQIAWGTAALLQLVYLSGQACIISLGLIELLCSLLTLPFKAACTLFGG
jgi:hypothetical protein